MISIGTTEVKLLDARGEVLASLTTANQKVLDFLKKVQMEEEKNEYNMWQRAVLEGRKQVKDKILERVRAAIHTL